MSQPQQTPLIPHSFAAKKDRILKSLSTPISEYEDLSPKGSIDAGIRDLIDEINALDGFVTTSSCAGRVSVYLDGQKGKNDGNEEELGSGEGEGSVERDRELKSGGKGGGRWLFVSHDPVTLSVREGECFSLLGLQKPPGSTSERGALGKESRLIHYKFEPMILHVLTSSLANANLILSAALQSGFRESGALNLISNSAAPATPMVGIRSMGLALESIVGFENEGILVSLGPEWQLQHLVDVSNERFKENEKRIARFRGLLKEMITGREIRRKKGQEGDEWEDKNARRERKMMEGRSRAEGLRREKEETASSSGRQDEVPNLGSLGI